MPRGDGTGPLGEGPFTGRGLGYCTGYVTDPAYFGRGRGGIGFGRGRGFGQGSRYNPRGLLRPRFIGSAVQGIPLGYSENPYQPPTREQELAALNSDKKEIETQLGGIEERIKKLRK